MLLYSSRLSRHLLPVPWSQSLFRSISTTTFTKSSMAAFRRQQRCSSCNSIIVSDFAPAYNQPSSIDFASSLHRSVQHGQSHACGDSEGSFVAGNGRVARIVAAAAAKHLTPLTLEVSITSTCPACAPSLMYLNFVQLGGNDELPDRCRSLVDMT